MVRLPDVLEGSIQKPTDIGVLGVIGPTINTVEQATALANFAKFPLDGRRSTGRNQAARIWGGDGINYRQTVFVEAATLTASVLPFTLPIRRLLGTSAGQCLGSCWDGG
jgi:2-keto-3-deoxy-L-rhamnonate aldolase RhmA